MVKGITKKYYWGIEAGKTIYIDFRGRMQADAIGIYDENKKFIVYTWDLETLEECVNY